MTTTTSRIAAGNMSAQSVDVAVTVQRLHKAYGDTTAVADVSFEVRRGEILGLLGPNGSGKTTTVECIQGLRRADAGHLDVLGLDPRTDIRQLRQLVGSQLQDSALPDRLKVWEALRLFSRMAPGGPGGSGCWTSGAWASAETRPSGRCQAGSASGCSSRSRWSTTPSW